jgi:hypothetical protein
MSAKPKAKPRSAKVAKAKASSRRRIARTTTMPAYDNKLYREYERGVWADDPPEGAGPFFREYYFRRRHLAWAGTKKDVAG